MAAVVDSWAAARIAAPNAAKGRVITYFFASVVLNVYSDGLAHRISGVYQTGAPTCYLTLRV